MQFSSVDTLHVTIHQAASHADIEPNYWLRIGIMIIGILSLLLLYPPTRHSLFGFLFKNVQIQEFSFDLTVFSVSGKLQATTLEQDIAWRLYIELVTRITSHALVGDAGSLREAITSLYTVFGCIREILKNGGPGLARVPKVNEHTVATLTLIILNGFLRPFLSKWHPKLSEWEHQKESEDSAQKHEELWEFNRLARSELEILRTGIEEYVDTLRRIAAGSLQNGSD